MLKLRDVVASSDSGGADNHAELHVRSVQTRFAASGALNAVTTIVKRHFAFPIPQATDRCNFLDGGPSRSGG
jgi:hypothetical protein